MDDVVGMRSTQSSSDPPRVPEREGVLTGVAEGAAIGGAKRIPMDPNPIDLGEGLGVTFRALRADHIDREPRVGQRLALLPDSPIEGNGQVLDDDEDAFALVTRQCPSTRLDQ